MGSILLLIWKTIEILLGFPGVPSGVMSHRRTGMKAGFHDIKKMSRGKTPVPLPFFLPYRVSLNPALLSPLS
jgi:hypothetical protein